MTTVPEIMIAENRYFFYTVLLMASGVVAFLSSIMLPKELEEKNPDGTTSKKLNKWKYPLLGIGIFLFISGIAIQVYSFFVLLPLLKNAQQQQRRQKLNTFTPS